MITLQVSHKTKPDIAEPVVRKVEVANGGTQEQREAAPTAATDNAGGAGDHQRITPPGQFPRPIILHPLPHVPVHVVKSVRVLKSRFHRMGLPLRVRRVPGVISYVCIPKRICCFRSSSGSIFPFCLCRKTVTPFGAFRGSLGNRSTLLPHCAS